MRLPFLALAALLALPPAGMAQDYQNDIGKNDIGRNDRGSGSTGMGSGSNRNRDRDRNKNNDRDKDRNNRRKNRDSKKTDGKSTAGKDGKDAKGGAATAAPAKGKASGGASSGKKSSSGGGGSTGFSLGDYKVTVDRDARILYIHPENRAAAQDVTVPVGTEFVTDVTFLNRDNAPMDEVSINLTYDRDYIEPLAVIDRNIAKFVSGAPDAAVDPARGLVSYKAKLKEPYSINNGAIISVRWRAKSITRSTEIEFGSSGDAISTITRGKADLLGNPADATDGFLSMLLTVVPQDAKEAEAFLSDPSLDAQGGKMGGVELSLAPPPRGASVGEPFPIDVILDNSAYSHLDDVAFLISFDPQVIEVVDADRNNYITAGTNIQDGPFHEAFPWGYHIANSVFPGRGLIYYRVGADDSEITRGKRGAIARIWCRAKSPTAGTPFAFRFIKESRGRGTDVSHLGTDCLGDPAVPNDGAKGLLLPVGFQATEVAEKTP